MERMENQILVRGSLQNLPRLSHENHGRRFFRFFLEVPRLSGAVDVLPVVADEALLLPLEPDSGSSIEVAGEIRTHNVRAGDGRHLQVFVFASRVEITEGEPDNQVTVTGNLCREPVLRRTPLGRDICDIMLAVPRAFHRADYLPCILWGSIAQEAARCNTGDRLTIQGRLQSRSYSKVTDTGTESRVAYEVSAMTARIPADAD